MVEQIAIPIELSEQLERRNVLLFVGEGLHSGILPSSAELASELAERCDYPPEEPKMLPRVAGYYVLTTHDRHGLIDFLRDRLDKPGLEPSPSQRLIAQLRPRVIVTTTYDHLLEEAAREAAIKYTSVVGNTEVAYGDEQKVLLVWLWGVLDRPDSVVITEDDRRRFLAGRENLSDVLRGELAQRTWLFLGFDAEDEWFRNFYDSVTSGLDRLQWPTMRPWAEHRASWPGTSRQRSVSTRARSGRWPKGSWRPWSRPGQPRPRLT